MRMDGTMLYHQELPSKNTRVNDYLQNIVSNNNNYKCECCPYGHHVNVDFVEFAKDISNSHNELQKIRRYQRKLERAQSNLLNKSDAYSTFPKESIIMSRNLTNQLSNSSSDSNSSDVNEPNIKHNFMVSKDNKMKKSQFSDIVYIPNNLNDYASRSSDDSNIQSLVIDNDDINISNKGMFTTISSSKNNSYNSKSFVISYEHLMSIREQMSSSLKRVQDLESEVKNVHNFRQKIEILTKENHQLKCELAHEKEINEINNTKSELNRKINETASNWCSLSDLPNQLIPNIERILNTKLSLPMISVKPPTLPKCLKSKTTQTDVNGSIIIDTLSYFTNSTKEFDSQINQEDQTIGPKIRKRNFGVTVRPTHHHFTQQITPTPIIDECLQSFSHWLQCCHDDIDKEIGVIIHQLLVNLFGNSYGDAIELLKSHLQYKTKSTEMKYCQTIGTLLFEACCQTNNTCINNISMSSQVEYEVKNNWTEMDAIIMIECFTATDRVVHRDCILQTDSSIGCDKIMQTEIKSGQDFSNNYRYIVECSDISSLTDKYLIDDMIAEQIEKSIALIHEELKVEITLSTLQQNELQKQLEEEKQKHNRSVIDQLQFSEKTMQSSHSSFVNNVVDSQSNNTTNNCNTQTNIAFEPLKTNIAIGHAALDQKSAIVNTNIDGGELNKQAISNLKRCEIIYSHFNAEESLNLFDNNPHESHKKFSKDHHNQDLNVDISHNSEQSDSSSSSPIEASYFSKDGRIVYKENNHIDELSDLDETMEDKIEFISSQSENKKQFNNLNLSQNDIVPIFPENVQVACELVALWMNDSTTTCSKDLNDSLAIIKQFWFDVTSDNFGNIKFYLDKFNSFNSTLQERIINMTDSNGNTCLHYAVSEGRWSIVRLLLQTRQVNVNKTNNVGYTVLMLVAVSENIDEESLKMLIDESQMNKQSVNDTQQTALMIAASQGKTLLVQLLLEKGASVNIKDSDGSTALMCACDNGHLEVVRLLLTRPDTDTELEDNTGCNAMKIALDNSHKDIALLIFARNNLQKIPQKSKRRSGSSSHPTSPLNQRKFK